MCSGSWNSKKHSCDSSPAVVIRQQQQQQQQKPHASMTLRRKRLRLRRRELRAGAEMEMLNLKLYLENRCILAENERLRERASALRRENLALRKTAATVLPAVAGAASGC